MLQRSRSLSKLLNFPNTHSELQSKLEVAPAHPLYSAILTKYTSLRSYQELTNKGSPLDYENAGVYTSSLLDSYMEYKLIWANITNSEYRWLAISDYTADADSGTRAPRKSYQVHSPN